MNQSMIVYDVCHVGISYMKSASFPWRKTGSKH